MTIKKAILSLLYLSTGAVSIFLIVHGGDYYLKPLMDRPHLALHDALKPGGLWGHGLGVIGTVLMLFLLLYLARKYWPFMRSWGNIGGWLDVHIWFGLTGPLLITFHTAFKFGGIVSVSFWSMVAVAASGIFGRYLYLQIPRRLSGEELTPEEIQAMDQTFTQQIRNLPTVEKPLLTRIQSLVQFTDHPAASRTSGIRFWIVDSLRLRFQLSNLRHELRTRTQLNRYMISDLIRAVKERRLLNRRVAFLKAAQRLLHHWHLIHRPFALVMYVIMVVHVLVTVFLGYTWIL